MIEVIRFIIGGLFLALIQTLIFKEVNIAWWIKPMPYVYLFLILPLSSNKFAVLIGAFFFGLTIDAFGGSLGMHTAACVTTVFVKNYIDLYFLDENSMQLQGMRYMQIDYKGWQWYATQAGMRQFSAQTDRPVVGDFVVTPVFVTMFRYRAAW